MTQQSESVGQNKQHPHDLSILRVFPVMELNMSGGHQTLKDLAKIVAVTWYRNVRVQKKNSHNFKDYKAYITTH